ncbi:MAG TPA: 4-(cytidine 5'-diphospho)-2-C-methyl-D-erythritol kinase [Trueperaceae bacterium]
MNEFLLEAHAKLNLGLWVVGRRDDGYHDIESLFVRLGLHDDVAVTPAGSLNGRVEADSGVRLEGLGLDDGNLAVRALRAYQRAAGDEREVRLELRKRIPLAAGLGGGSSDAAQVLLALARLYPAAVELDTLALELGSDVPFFMSGQAAAWASGRGERLEPVSLPPIPVVLLKPDVAVSASEAYGLLAEVSPPPDRRGLLERLSSSSEPEYLNSLQAGVVEEYPVVGEALETLRHAGLRGVLMSGSGSTCFGLAESEQEAALVAQGLRARYPGWWAWSGLAAV